jgi:hypothetical protein
MQRIDKSGKMPFIGPQPAGSRKGRPNAAILFHGASEMKSPLVRVIVGMLGGYLVILLVLVIYDWYAAEYPTRPPRPESIEPIQHPVYHEQSVEALKRFSRLADSEKRRIRDSLESAILPVTDWLARLERSVCEILCLGEFHEESTRQYLADVFFTEFKVDVLLLEATTDELRRVMRKMEAGRDYFPLLDADILNVLRAVRIKNPDTRIYGIEATGRQPAASEGRANPRDLAIARNVWDRFQSGKRHVILIGGLHCANESNWLFGRLMAQAPPALKKRLSNVWVLGEHQNGSLEAFLFFCDGIGIELNAGGFVIADAGALHPRLLEWFHVLDRQLLKPYAALIVFRRPGPHPVSYFQTGLHNGRSR